MTWGSTKILFRAVHIVFTHFLATLHSPEALLVTRTFLLDLPANTHLAAFWCKWVFGRYLCGPPLSYCLADPSPWNPCCSATALTNKMILQKDWKHLLAGLFEDGYGQWTASGCSPLPGKNRMHLDFPVQSFWPPCCLRNHTLLKLL